MEVVGDMSCVFGSGPGEDGGVGVGYNLLFDHRLKFHTQISLSKFVVRLLAYTMIHAMFLAWIFYCLQYSTYCSIGCRDPTLRRYAWCPTMELTPSQ